MIYNVSMKIAHLLENEQAVAVFDRFLPGMRRMAESNPQAAALSVEQLVRYTRNPKANEVVAALDQALNELNTPENAVSPSERKLIEKFKAIAAEAEKKAALPETHHQDAIYPGRPWLDTRGERIQAGKGADTPMIRGEFSLNGVDNPLSHTRGTLSMARLTGYDTAASQFFICLGDQSYFDGAYAAFGRVVKGMEYADRIAGAALDESGKPLSDQTIKTIRVDLKEYAANAGA